MGRYGSSSANNSACFFRFSCFEDRSPNPGFFSVEVLLDLSGLGSVNNDLAIFSSLNLRLSSGEALLKGEIF